MPRSNFLPTYASESYTNCPICGHSHLKPEMGGDCDPKVIAGIEAAHRRADEDIFIPAPTIGERFRQGFAMLDPNFDGEI